MCLPIGLGKNAIDCNSPEVGGLHNFVVREPDPYGLDSSGVGDGIGCESEVRGTTATRSDTASGTDAAGLAATGSKTPYLLLLAGGLILLGLAAHQAVSVPVWHTTGDPNVRFTVDRIRRKR